ncbi:MAG: bifunctional ornithine acetyltransferase/N-acetylglutamate synthase [Acidimicrobiales bacterium]
MNVSPLAPAEFPVLPSIAGVRLSPLELRLRYHGRPDVLLASFDEGTTVAGAFTTSKCPSAPVDWCKSILGNGVARALVVNAGNANAFTGRHGDASTRATAAAVSSALGIAESEVFLASTGVIGEPLDVGPIVAAVPELVGGLSAADAENLKSAAHAIRTTDTFPKAEGARATLPSGAVVNVAGIAKGSGMIEPAMATMLSFVFTDAAITAEALQSMLSPSVTTSYNAITVDSDTSTSDTVLVLPPVPPATTSSPGPTRRATTSWPKPSIASTSAWRTSSSETAKGIEVRHRQRHRRRVRRRSSADRPRHCQLAAGEDGTRCI